MACLCLAQALIKQDNLDAFNEKDPYKADDAREDEDDNDDNDNSLEAESFPLERDEVMPPPIPHPPAERVSFPKGLPWAPKVRCGRFFSLILTTSDTMSVSDRRLFAPTEKRTLKTFWNQAEVNSLVTLWASEFEEPKIAQYNLDMFLCSVKVSLLFLFLLLCYSDTDTVVGLPRPIHESIKTLKQVWLCTSLRSMDYFCSLLLINIPWKDMLPIVTGWTLISLQHKYVSIAEIQVAKEEEFQKTPLSGVSGNKLFAHSPPAVWKCCRLCSGKLFRVSGLGSLLQQKTTSGCKVQTFSSLTSTRVKRRWRCPPPSSSIRGFCPVCLSIWFVLLSWSILCESNQSGRGSGVANDSAFTLAFIFKVPLKWKLAWQRF